MALRVLHWRASLGQDGASDIDSLSDSGKVRDGEKRRRGVGPGVRLMHRTKNIPYVVSTTVVGMPVASRGYMLVKPQKVRSEME